MPIVLAGIAVVVLLFLVRGYSLADSKALLRQLRFSAGLTLAFLCISLLATRRIDFAIAAGITSAILLAGSGAEWRRLYRGATSAGASCRSVTPDCDVTRRGLQDSGTGAGRHQGGNTRGASPPDDAESS